MQSTLIIYLKAPIEGFVKTRLARNIGHREALKTYRKLVKNQLSKLPRNQHTQVHFTPEDELTTIKTWLGDAYKYEAQATGDLGQRLTRSIASAFQQGCQSCICIGSDCPALDMKHIHEAEAALNNGADVVFGPCQDGGYYLIGLKAPAPQLFEDIPWSTQDTLAVSLQRAKTLRLKIHLLETLYDVDDLQNLKQAIYDGHLPKDAQPPSHPASEGFE